jgi:hypothetical protein
MPTVKVSHGRYLLGIGGPHREISARVALSLQQVRSQFFIEAEVAALVKEIEVVITQQGNIVTQIMRHGSPIFLRERPGYEGLFKKRSPGVAEYPGEGYSPIRDGY